MRSSHLVAGVMTGAALGLGGVLAADLGTDSADAQSSNPVTQGDLKAANERSQSAIRRATNLQNAVGKFFTTEGVRIGTRQPPGVIRQDAGTGQNGLPTETILDAAITNSKLGDESVSSEKIAPGGVTSGDLADSSVQTSKVEPGAITGQKLAGGSVSTDKIGDGAITEGKIDPSLARGIAKFAYVGSNAELGGNRGFTAASAGSNGEFELTTAFPVSREQCAINATVNRFGINMGFYAKYEVSGPNEITVFTYDENGDPNSEAFSITVFCA